MDKKENTYIQVLLWAYDKQHNGFTMAELYQAFNLDEDKQKQMRHWIHDIFFRGSNNDRALISNFGSKYALTDKGISAAVDYLELKQARESGKRALIVAIIAITIAIFVGLYQIFVPAKVIVVEDQLQGTLSDETENSWTLSLYRDGATIIRLDSSSKEACISAGRSYLADNSVQRFDCGYKCSSFDRANLQDSPICEKVCNEAGCR